MEQFAHDIAQVVGAHSEWAYAVLFLAALLEAVPVLGSFVPGSTIILSLSALIPGGDLSLPGVLAAAMAGAMVGDGSAYELGRRYPERIRTIWPLRNYPALIERSGEFFRNYGYAAVFLARFLPPVRAFLPITAGAFGMPPARFFAMNIAAICCWAPAHVLPGVLAGTAYGHAGAWAGHLALPIIAGVVAVAAVVWAVRRWCRTAEA
jgi:membrane protein DedA with SNARE-associated domain